jgi:two-component system response regulator DesR
VIRVLVAEDVRMVRDTLVALLGLEADIEVAAAVASGDQIVPAALEHRPDVALLDIGLPGADGLTAAAELAGRLPGCRVLILTGLEASGNLGAAMRAGACGSCSRTSRRKSLSARCGRWPGANGSSTRG